ncbi:uncharacterized protein N7515_004418 [Penicillium bovifimosum]|uniref:Uncharacterized protein n=1 Tax=Penicillium bovifimosum TaxID=126998 RepID=A0A9W9H0F4_9EURO|nr:uncharacterized protein N7515_004418 [Penicillium bovifimosum]KAJ5135140.1 hypothetical protein N7515_004418 [Penicillium bovifimosum]
MDDAVRPSKEEFDRILSESYDEWSSHLTNAHESPRLPPSSIELKSLLERTPSYLGYGSVPKDTQLPFTFVERELSRGQFGLLISGQSTWTTSNGQCCLEPKTIPLDILMAVPTPLAVEISNSAPMQEWPGVDGISNHDEGNYISILFLAWAYILSARWAESLKHAPGHQCSINFKRKASQLPTGSRQHDAIEIDVGHDVEAAEAAWWRSILWSGGGWEITTDYNKRTYCSPWSVMLSDNANMGIAEDHLISKEEPPSSDVALEYLARFCSRHRLYGQCSVALVAALYIPLISGDSISLPVPESALQHGPSSLSQKSSNLVKEYSKSLSRYMMLSCNAWGMRSLISSTFFNPKVECNLASAWLNPIFAVTTPLIQGEKPLTLAKVLAYRQPRLASLWLGAIIVGLANSTIRNIRIGLTATELNAAAWTGTLQSFITMEPGCNDGQMIRREDECRLLFITACDGYTRIPIQPWKPFGETRLLDTELAVQQHAACRCHCLKYEAWH